jgi:hypothetical protein
MAVSLAKPVDLRKRDRTRTDGARLHTVRMNRARRDASARKFLSIAFEA